LQTPNPEYIRRQLSSFAANGIAACAGLVDGKVTLGMA
jgi:hypothetical protein